MLLTTIVTSLTLAAGAAPVQERELRALALPFDAAQDSSTQVYEIKMNGSSNKGSMSLRSKATLVTTIHENQITLADTWDIMGRQYNIRLDCVPDAVLSPTGGEVTVSAKGKTQTAHLLRTEDLLVVESDGKTQPIKFPAWTLTQAAVFRVLSVLPAEAGVVYQFDAFSEAIEMTVHHPEEGERFTISFVGRENVRFHGNSVPCSKFVLSVHEDWNYFVDDSGRIVRAAAVNGEVEMNLVNNDAFASVEIND